MMSLVNLVQETARYGHLIRRHVDLSTMRARLEEGGYSGSTEFFRDLLLIFNNALVYYERDAPEHVASKILRDTAMLEMNKILKTEALLKHDGPSTRKREPKKGGSSGGVSTTPSVSGRRGSLRLSSMDNRSSSETMDVDELSKRDNQQSSSSTAMVEGDSGRDNGGCHDEEEGNEKFVEKTMSRSKGRGEDLRGYSSDHNLTKTFQRGRGRSVKAERSVVSGASMRGRGTKEQHAGVDSEPKRAQKASSSGPVSIGEKKAGVHNPVVRGDVKSSKTGESKVGVASPTEAVGGQARTARMVKRPVSKQTKAPPPLADVHLKKRVRR